tara:strand:- start:4224 stop:5399 length:1176 start_codon:yes stop_codon:yes gene_type:complete
MIKNIFCSLFLVFNLIFFSINSIANEINDNSRYEISILTIGEGSSLADAFGHSGIRVKDLHDNSDIVYNFGLYDYSSPNFYSNFVKGRPQYKLGIQNYSNFIRNYEKEKRYIFEQQINIDGKSKEQIINLLEKNLKSPYYTYDYLRDNCATRIADLIIENTNNKFKTEKIENKTQISFRNLIHDKINENSWAALGIDLCLGAVIDQKINLRETLFMPEMLMNYLDEFNSEVNFVNKKTIYIPETKNFYKESITSPLLVNLIFSLIIIITTVFNFKNNYWSKILDVIIFLITGSVGILVLYLWFFSDHIAAAQNFNFLWAFPFNFALIFGIYKNKTPNWFIGYIKLLIILIILLFLHWLTGVQKYNITLLSIFMALLIRYSFLVYYIKKNKK